MKLLHIVATPREGGSNTLLVAREFIDTLAEQVTDLEVTTVDLYRDDLPAVAGTNIEVKYSLSKGGPVDRAHQESWTEIESLIATFMSSDIYVISCPMWNLSIPYALKYYIDCLIQPGYVFEYDEAGRPLPLVHGKRLVCITSRGGDYGPESPLGAYDFQEPYLRAIFGFIGVTDVAFVNAQPMDVSALRDAALASATAQARGLAGASAAFGMTGEIAS
ncbi:NAD(P)H-dependent oxidoreductase [Nocardioides sp.]|uniref:FMN-dependent NADH-azoreductase n=1 Tax=Nocardioides sp. TaxID=35761 RepID=UPI0031FE7B9A|nr:azoR [Nocardioides sp.]